MTTLQQIIAWGQLGRLLKAHAKSLEWHTDIDFISEQQYISFEKTIEKTFYKNGWFEENEVRNAMLEISEWLTDKNLENWLSNYNRTSQQDITVAVIMAGNIPLVGFHDLMCVLFSGFKVKIKLSSEDDVLIPEVINYLTSIAPFYANRVSFSDRKIGDFDAIIATGDKLSNKTFQTYFSMKPHLFRGHRTSVAALTGDETAEELKFLGQDVFQYYGRGCRNVTHLCVPVGYDFADFFHAIVSYSHVIQNKKYGNNYDYCKAIQLMNGEKVLDNNFMLLKNSEDLHPPIAMLYYHEYSSKEALEKYLEEKAPEIQCIMGRSFLPFGSAQKPKIDDYADNFDTMKWLASLA